MRCSARPAAFDEARSETGVGQGSFDRLVDVLGRGGVEVDGVVAADDTGEVAIRTSMTDSVVSVAATTALRNRGAET